MSKRTTFTSITPLPSGVSRAAVLDFLHDHLMMIDLNPLIKERFRISPPDYAEPEERACAWYQLRDEVSYLPGVSGSVNFTCAFHDLPLGLQTHCYAPMGLHIRDKWSVGGNLPGEPPEPIELGIGAPMSGLYLREDVDLRCNIIATPFVKKTLKRAHASLVDLLASKAALGSSSTVSSPAERARLRTQGSWGTQASHGSHGSHGSYGSNAAPWGFDRAAAAGSNPSLYQPTASHGRNPSASPYMSPPGGLSPGMPPPAARSAQDLDWLGHNEPPPRPRSSQMVDGKLMSLAMDNPSPGHNQPGQGYWAELQ